ncbi:hydroxymethylbilane synthase [Desulfotomaculum copahuensis]|uniref:Porphobilinogen deaminase n=1 Tax=Desulfotomaculum copahuensis TaxID=1838280 RepID=A0A1B7LH90_9FIRM|nr:hydroxymethylbilane synthase [Desulfotomaculum copahuensis]OAT85517.1 hydroxymethylbilane synthase [Desulfotomaculum copahuensis]
MNKEIVIGTRESRLALWQARWVAEQLQSRHPGVNFRLQGMKTHGDNILDVALAKIGDKGLFTKELELALLKGKIDLAVHSMKDLPTELPPGLSIGAICRREYPGDVLISRRGLKLAELPSGARVGTSSLRRTAQLLRFRPDLQISTMRGNLTTRLRKLTEQNLDALVLAYAGVHRLGLAEQITQRIPFDICLPAVGQGAIGVEIRSGDERIQSLIDSLNDRETQAAVTAERALMKELEGGCQVPVGALGRVDGEMITLEGIVASLDGRRAVRDAVTGPVAEASALGRTLARRMLAAGAAEILNAARQEFDLHA